MYLDWWEECWTLCAGEAGGDWHCGTVAAAVGVVLMWLMRRAATCQGYGNLPQGMNWQCQSRHHLIVVVHPCPGGKHSSCLNSMLPTQTVAVGRGHWALAAGHWSSCWSTASNLSINTTSDCLQSANQHCQQPVNQHYQWLPATCDSTLNAACQSTQSVTARNRLINTTSDCQEVVQSGNGDVLHNDIKHVKGIRLFAGLIVYDLQWMQSESCSYARYCFCHHMMQNI